MDKQEKIKEAWLKAGYTEEDIRPYIDNFYETGWIRFDIRFKYLKRDEYDPKKFDYINISYLRPKSLKGIENNNGWTALNQESYENLKNGFYMWYNNENGDWEIDNLSESHIKNYTHFQEIVTPPKPPIY